MVKGSLLHIAIFIFILPACSPSTRKLDKKTAFDKMQLDTLQKQSDKKLRLAWENFRKAIKTSDFAALRTLSTDCIKCPNCVTNTTHEETFIDKFRNDNPDSWYHIFYDSLSVFPFQRFIKEDYALVFDRLLLRNMFIDSLVQFYNSDQNFQAHTNPCILSKVDIKTPKLMEVFIQLMKPSSTNGGATAALAFIETKNGYFFCGYSTIP